MKKRKTAIIVSALFSMTVITSCGTSTPAVTPNAGTTQPVAQTEVPESATETAVISETAKATDTTATFISEQPDNRVDIPESEFISYTEKTYDANQRKAIFSNHTSLIIDSDFNIDPGEFKADYCWFAEDVTYYKAPAYEEFSLPDVRFELLGIGSEWYPTATYFFDMMEGGYQYWPVPENKENWYDPEHEVFTEMYIQDGRLYTASVYDEEGSANFYSVMLPQVAYTGGTIRFYSVADAETYEFIEESYYIEKDGVSERLFTDRYEYDQPIPHCVNVIDGMFERATANTMTVTITAHPGEENEITKSAVIPVNSMVSINVPDMTDPVYYNDYECTQPFTNDWDMMSDLTLFIRDNAE